MKKLHLGHNVLDHQLLDKDGRRCGNVDDLAIEGEGEVGDPLRARLLAEPRRPARSARRLDRTLEACTHSLGGGGEGRLRRSLRGTASEYGLGSGDDRLRPLLERVPGANR